MSNHNTFQMLWDMYNAARYADRPGQVISRYASMIDDRIENSGNSRSVDSATARKLEIAFTHWRDKAVVVALRADRQALQSQKDALYEAVKSHAPEDDNYNGGEPEVYNEAQTVNRNNREWNEVLAAAFGKDKL